MLRTLVTTFHAASRLRPKAITPLSRCRNPDGGITNSIPAMRSPGVPAKPIWPYAYGVRLPRRLTLGSPQTKGSNGNGVPAVASWQLVRVRVRQERRALRSPVARRGGDRHRRAGRLGTLPPLKHHRTRPGPPPRPGGRCRQVRAVLPIRAAAPKQATPDLSGADARDAPHLVQRCETTSCYVRRTDLSIFVFT